MATSDDPVAVLGTGAIGSAVTRALLGSGRPVIVWNRTAARTDPLVDAGAARAATAAEALAAAPLSVLTLTDYVAVDALLEASISTDLAGRAVVALVTGSPEDARAAARRVGTTGASYLDGGIHASPESIGTPAATLLLSGSASAFAEHAPTLELLGTPRFIGEEPDAAATLDLALYGAWYDAQLGLLRALELVRTAGVDIDQFAELVAAQLDHVPRGVTHVVGEVRAGVFPPGPATLVEHLVMLEQLVAVRGQSSLGAGGLDAVAARIEREIADGQGKLGLTSLVSGVVLASEGDGSRWQ
ncbi:NAD(P)-dependent oxidoreductase [Nocardioides silvaticus]|uniref:NAD(P)-dependent oxidoreductase n=1 Tax=Nocardioides silvaticus TaxID=2201891 RepID=A0A316TD36_9ACTN|nr:NAD(P)-binding domain-containing protein [Nocardioides silvaticus]PWN02303.1 NAD(P)-dependent oxidoreductase [Nocardioides silvaticus]